MISVGETLKRERLKKNLGLEQVSRETKISEKLLEYIESERFDQLPGGVFTRSFVRQYARFLGLDDDELVSELNRQLQPAPPELPSQTRHRDIVVPRVSQWNGVSDRLRPRSSSMPAFILVLLVMMACAGAYTLWQRSRRVEQGDSSSSTAAGMRRAPAPQIGAGSASRTEMSRAEPDSAPPASAQADPQQPGPSLRKQSAAETTAPAASEPGGGPLHVVITASEPTWISIHSDEKYIYSGTLAASEIKTVDAAAKVRIQTGNAGGIEVRVNGKPAGALGPRGQIRSVNITADAVQIVPRKPVISSDSL
jgi:cytoskeleton protein RodZ